MAKSRSEGAAPAAPAAKSRRAKAATTPAVDTGNVDTKGVDAPTPKPVPVARRPAKPAKAAASASSKATARKAPVPATDASASEAPVDGPPARPPVRKAAARKASRPPAPPMPGTRLPLGALVETPAPAAEPPVDPLAPDAAAPAAVHAASDEAVVRYLRDHPDFFERHADLLAGLSLRHAHGGRAVSLIERQVEVLRLRERALEAQLADLMRRAQENDAISGKLHALVRAVILEPDPSALPGRMEAVLREQFAVPQVVVRLWTKEEAGGDDPVVSCVHGLFVPYCGPLGGEASMLADALGLDGDGRATRSLALIPLRVGARPESFGLLAMGSPDADRFAANMGTLFLERIGEIASAALSRTAAR